MSAFLEIPESGWIGSNGLAFAIRDRFPVSRGHTLTITRRVVRDWFCATSAERAALLELVDVVKKQLEDELHPDGFNVGFNTGAAAGQTVEHLHVHVIPRFQGDMDDPRGGVRPSRLRGIGLSPMRFLPCEGITILTFLSSLSSRRFI